MLSDNSFLNLLRDSGCIPRYWDIWCNDNLISMFAYCFLNVKYLSEAVLVSKVFSRLHFFKVCVSNIFNPNFNQQGFLL